MVAQPQKVTTYYKEAREAEAGEKHHEERRELNRKLREKQTPFKDKAARAVSSAGSWILDTGRKVNDKVQERHKDNPLLGRGEEPTRQRKTRIDKYKNGKRIESVYYGEIKAPKQSNRNQSTNDLFGGIGSGMNFNDLMLGAGPAIGPYGVEPTRSAPSRPAPRRKKKRSSAPPRRRRAAPQPKQFDFVKHMNTPPPWMR